MAKEKKYYKENNYKNYNNKTQTHIHRHTKKERKTDINIDKDI